MLNLLNDIRATRSRIDKENLLAGHKHLPGETASCFRDILHYAYHPLKHYGLQKLPWTGEGINSLLNTHEEWIMMLEHLENGTLSGQRAKDVVSEFITDLDQENAELFKQILKKDLRAGFSTKTINKAFEAEFIPVFGAMLASKWDGKLNGSVYMSLKLDGLRGVYRHGTMYSRNGHKIIGVSHITDYLKSLDILDLDGELTIPGKHFQDVSGDLRSHANCPEAIYSVFDTGVEGVQFIDRYNTLSNYNLSGPCKLVKHVLTSDIEKVINTFGKALDAGYEGLVLKHPEHTYKRGARNKSWMKMKDTLDEDLPIIGFFEGEGRLVGTLGGIIVIRSNGVQVRVGSGFTDDERHEIWHDHESFIDQVAEIHYHEETPDGSLRHPIFKGIRWDKSGVDY